MSEEVPTLLQETREALEHMQSFDVERLPRESELGRSFQFRDAVQPATRLVQLYQRLAASALDDLPDAALTQVRERALVESTILGKILDFDETQG